MRKMYRRDFSKRGVTTGTAIIRREHEIALLREYRTRLVVDVVTGKPDLREAHNLLSAETVQESITCKAVEDIPIEFEETTDGEA